jgi:NAD(P)-dependent dehydrogenase (short-subunit alcohol dehydrogenase family)
MERFLDEQVCLVTGGAQGIAWALAQALADHGARVYACDISEEHLARATQDLAALPWPDRIALARCDVSNRAEYEGWIDQVYRQTGRIDVLVNSAAFVRGQSIVEMSVEDTLRTMRVGYDALVYGVKAVLPLMLEAGRGHIVNFGSSAGKVFVGGHSAAYAAAKAAIDGYTQMLQFELRDSPIHVLLVRPAVVAGTDFWRKHVESSRNPRLGDFVPYVTPPQIAEAVVRAIHDRRLILDVPRFLWLFYWLFALSPRLTWWLFTQGGPARREYGEVEWEYVPRERRT